MILPMTRTDPGVASMKDYLQARLRETEAPLCDPFRARLIAHGAELVPNLLAIVRYVLWDSGVHDERIWEMACRAFEEDQELGANAFRGCGDPRALPILEEAIRAIAAEGEEQYPLGDLLWSYDDLDGSLPDDLAEAVRVAYARRGWTWEPAPRVKSE